MATAVAADRSGTRSSTCRSKVGVSSIATTAASASPNRATNRRMPTTPEAVTRRRAAVPLVLRIQAYRLLLSTLLGPRCRHAPSCSAYAIEALERHGALRGGALALRRLLRCHPWGSSGYDPVP